MRKRQSSRWEIEKWTGVGLCALAIELKLQCFRYLNICNKWKAEKVSYEQNEEIGLWTMKI